jgi:MFS transporter, PAT family, beta-lactamase induction signal transducer AmpG
MVARDPTPSQPEPPPPRRLDLLSSSGGRRLLFAVLYFAEGAPIGFVWWTLPVLLRRAGLGPEAIGALTGTLVLPWALKFVWAPLVDVLRGPRFGLRGWIAASQVAMVATLLPLVWIDVARSTALLAVLLVLHACAAATQDVAIDALAIRTTPAGEHGALNGWMQAGMLLGRGIFGGAVLALREPLGEHGMAGLLVLAVAAAMLAHLLYRSPEGAEHEHPAGAARWKTFARTLRSVFARPQTWLVLVFAASSGAAFEVAGAMAGPYLVDSGFDDAAISGFFALPAVLGLGLGALAGGPLSDRFGRRRIVALSGAFVACAVAWLAFAGSRSPLAAWSALGLVYLGAGFFTASSYALFMDATDPRLGATQFSAYMGATNLCESWSARTAGRVASAAGYPAAFLLGAAVTLAALPLLLLPLVPGARSRGGDAEGPPAVH